MEQTFEIEKPSKKIYNEKAIWPAAFLGGPLAGGYLIAENFKAFNEAGKAKKTWFFTILATILIFGGIFFIPENIDIPNYIIPLIYTAIAYYIMHHFQGQNISKHISAGGQLYSWGRTIAVGFIGLAITSIPIIGFVLLTVSFSSDSISTNTYGLMKHEISYDKDNITELEVTQLAEGLTKTLFFDEALTKYVFVK